MNIGLLSYECPPANDRAISFPNKQRYCDKHGYDFIFHTKNLAPSLHPAWSKVPYILKYLPYLNPSNQPHVAIIDAVFSSTKIK